MEHFLHLLTLPDFWMGLATLTILEIVLGIDNVIFISVLVSRLPKARQAITRRAGLGLAVVTRLLLLFSIAWLASLTTPVLHIGENGFSWRDMVLFFGGLFLLYKATVEIHHTMEGHGEGDPKPLGNKAFLSIITQIAVIDIVFSLDSVITAVGMVDHVEAMALAIIIAVGVMLWASGPIGDFIQNHPTTKMLAFSFLMIIGAALVADGLHFHIPRGYLYFAVAFSLAVEVLNLTATKKRAKRQG